MSTDRGHAGRSEYERAFGDRLIDVARGTYCRVLSRVQSQITRSVGDASATFAISSPEDAWGYSAVGHDLGGERAVLERLLDDLYPDDVFWDVGAAKGIYSCLVAPVLGDGSVVAFEPGPERREWFRTNVEINELQNVDLRSVALGEESGSGKFVDAAATPAAAGPVDLCRGDALVSEGTQAPDVVKLDVEGGEAAALRGLGSVLDDVRVVYVEQHPHRVPVTEVREHLEAHGFHVEKVWCDCTLPHLRASR